jgi:hypothetical protein
MRAMRSRASRVSAGSSNAAIGCGPFRPHPDTVIGSPAEPVDAAAVLPHEYMFRHEGMTSAAMCPSLRSMFFTNMALARHALQVIETHTWPVVAAMMHDRARGQPDARRQLERKNMGAGLFSLRRVFGVQLPVAVLINARATGSTGMQSHERLYVIR